MAIRRSHPHWSVWVFVASAIVAVGMVIATRDHDSEPATVNVEATSIYQFASLDEMVAASDAIVVGRVTATERGRLVGDPENGGVISRLVTVAVDDVLAGVVDAGSILVEEEGWLTDDTPITVNGVAASEVGDEGLWFLDFNDDAELASFLVINSQGRFLFAADGTVHGGDQRDALVQQLQRQSPAQLLTSTTTSITRQV
jgi:hypothetical protein